MSTTFHFFAFHPAGSLNDCKHGGPLKTCQFT